MGLRTRSEKAWRHLRADHRPLARNPRKIGGSALGTVEDETQVLSSVNGFSIT